MVHCGQRLAVNRQATGTRPVLNSDFHIRINEQWRLCFDWQDNNAYNVEIADYHYRGQI
ncbi:MAG: type II toxin-antitoxin system RelE/ParE family toxin [Anaerolineae bacterium]|nr:type II toxin-antitoxin system RelE/ParE family toxin [Anaerolineae bacterium]